MSNKIIYKIAPRELWAQAEKAGSFVGAPVDIADGYIHFPQQRRCAQRRPNISPGRAISCWCMSMHKLLARR